jgi:drug/metabolite transporter (DMT)-like permease
MALTIVRIWLPAAIALVGVALIALGGDAADGAGIVLIGVACLVVLANVLIRLSVSSERDRQREEERRRSERGP